MRGGAAVEGSEPRRKRNDKAMDEDVPMPRQEPEDRVKNFEEVALGYTEEMALAEAARCLKCKNPQCQKGCPVEVPIPQFIDLHHAGEVRRRHSDHQVQERPAGRLRPGLPAGGAVPEELHPRARRATR